MGADSSETETSSDDGEEAVSLDPRSNRLPTMSGRPDLEMSVIGWLIFLIMIVLLLPLLPALVLAVILGKLIGMRRQSRLSW